MKNVINYYYELNIDNIHQVNGIYYFTYLNNNYMLKEYYQDINKLLSIYNLNKKIKENNIYFHTIILNKDGVPYIIVNNKCYVLLKISNIVKDKMSIYDINYMNIDIDKSISSLLVNDWYTLWCNKVDYMEYKLEHIKNNREVSVVYHFFIGLSENAISYIKNIYDRYGRNTRELVVSHRRISISMSLVDFYDPLDLVIDNKVRDLSEYIKSSMVNNTFDYRLIDEYISNYNFTDYDYSLLMARILFPSCFYDNIQDENCLCNFDIDRYILYLKDIYLLIRSKSNIEEIYWLNKVIN